MDFVFIRGCHVGTGVFAPVTLKYSSFVKSRTYGSEHQLFRHRRDLADELDRTICGSMSTAFSPLKWIYPLNVDAPGSEPEGLGFIPEAKGASKELWPARGSQQCWDGVAKLGSEWLLMEGKANHPEFTGAPCTAQIGSEARKKIERTLGRVKRHLGVHRDFSWMGSYYQHANRLAALYFLHQQRIPARLAFLYVVGERFPDGRRCPSSEEEWSELFRARQLTLGLSTEHPLSEHIHHHVFLHAK